MKKVLLSLICLLAVIGVSAAEQVVATMTPGADNWHKNSSYSGSLNSLDGLWTLVNFNNNNNGWTDFVKCGSKNAASTGEIVTAQPISATVSKAVLNINKINEAASLNSITLYIADNDAFTNAVSVPLAAPAAGDNDFVIPAPAANKYYKVAIDCAKAAANGVVWVSSFTLYGEEGGAPSQLLPAGLQFSAATASAVIGQTFTAPTLSKSTNAAVTYKSSNAAVATVDAATGAVTLVAAGQTVITAEAEANDTYQGGTASYTLTVSAEPVVDPDAETATFDWTAPTALNPAQQTPGEGADNAVNLDGVTLTENGVSVAFSKGTATTDTRLYLYREAVELRAYKNNTMTVTAPAGKNITDITFEGNYAGDMKANVSSGTFTPGKPSVWKGEANSVTFTWTATSKMSSMTVTYGGEGGDPNPPTPPTPGDGYESLEAWLAAKPAADAALDASLTAIYQDGKDLWVCENGTYALVYGTIEQTYKNGDRIPAPVSGKYEEYNGMPEFVPVASTFGAGEEGEAVAAQAVEIADVTVADVARYIRLEGVQISATDNELNFEATDGTNTVVLRNRYSKSVTIPVTDNATVYGFVGVYNSTVQIYPILIENEDIPGPGPSDNTVTFDFNNPSSLNPAQQMPGEGAEGAVNLTNVTLTQDNVTISFILPADLEGKSKDPRLYLYKGNSELRMYSGTSMTVATNDGSAITRIEFQVSYADNINGTATSGNITTGKPSYWDGNAQTVTFDWNATSKANKILVTTTNDSGIESVETINLTPAVYYNLQGMRVENPANGIFIRVQGNNVDKVLVK